MTATAWGEILKILKAICPMGDGVEIVEMERGPWRVPHTATVRLEAVKEGHCSIIVELSEPFSGEYGPAGEPECMSLLTHEYYIDCADDFSTGHLVEYRMADIDGKQERDSGSSLGHFWMMSTLPRPGELRNKSNVQFIAERFELMSVEEAEENLLSDLQRISEAIDKERRQRSGPSFGDDPQP